MDGPQHLLRRLATPVVLVLAVLYFVIDAVFLSVLGPLVRRLDRVSLLQRLGAWVRTLGPYPALALFLVPIALLEPVKPVGLYLIAVGRPVAGVLVIAVGELLKIVVVERLFHLTRDKLLTIPVFARLYRFVVGWLDWLKALPPWQMVTKAAGRLRAFAAEMRGEIRDRAERLRNGRL